MPPTRTRIMLLGQLAIERDDVEGPAASLAGRRSEIVFAYLAVEHRRSVSRDELADALWPETLPDTWNAALRGVLTDVRRFLERAGLDPATTLITEQGRLRFRLPDDAVLDVDQARDDLAQARALLADGDPSGAALAAGRSADAAALPFLSFLDGTWADGVRTDLDELHIAALEVHADALARSGDARGAIGAADRLVRAAPFLEAAHRLRITLLGDAGDRAGALKAFERCKTLLAAELGIEPTPETAEALRRALQATAASPTDPSGTNAEASIDASPFAGYSVLVVEDHDFQRRTTLTLLRGLGVTQVADASDGSAALALLENAPAPDVIVCDLDMPGMDGVEFIRNVGERRLASAVVIASGLDDRVLQTVRAASEGYGLQVLGAVGKPLTALALEGLLASYRPPNRSAPAAADAQAMGDLAASLDDGTLAAAFEPIVDLAVGRVAAVRVVASTSSPDDLQAAVDAAGLGRKLVEHLLRQARVAARGLDIDVFLALSPGLLTDVRLADALAMIARDRVVLVADARALADAESPAMLDVLARLRVKGYELCIAGFEPGSLERLPLTRVEVPAELIAASAAQGAAAPLQPAVEAARALGVPVIGRCATPAEFDVLIQAGCSYAYGPFLAPAVSAPDLAAVARDWAAPPATAEPAR